MFNLFESDPSKKLEEIEMKLNILAKTSALLVFRLKKLEQKVGMPQFNHEEFEKDVVDTVENGRRALMEAIIRKLTGKE